MDVINNKDYAVSVWVNPIKIGAPYPGKLSPGASATVLDIQNNFAKVFVKNNTGWIDLNEVDKINEVPPPENEEPPIPPIPPLPTDKPRGEGKFIILKNSMQVYKGLSRPSVLDPRGQDDEGLPDMWPITPEISKDKQHFTLMTEDICHWMFRLNVEKFQGVKFESEAAYRDFWASLPKTHPLILDWKSLMKGDRSHTNRYGSDTCWDPISQADRKGKPFMRYFQVVTGRWVAKVNSERTTQWKVECIDASTNYRQYDPSVYWWLFDEPLITARVKVLNSNGKWDGRSWLHVSRPYEQFAPARPILPVLLSSDSRGMIYKSISRLLDSYEVTPGKYS